MCAEDIHDHATDMDVYTQKEFSSRCVVVMSSINSSERCAFRDRIYENNGLIKVVQKNIFTP